MRNGRNSLSGLVKNELGKIITDGDTFIFITLPRNTLKMPLWEMGVFMPVITPNQKVQQSKMHGEDFVEIRLRGDTFDECALLAKEFTQENNMTFIHPFDDYRVMEGQGTVALEIFKELNKIDYVLIPVGGGGLAAGAGTYLKMHSPNTRIIGVEAAGAPSMHTALKEGTPVTLKEVDPFVDGAAVKRVGEITFPICKEILEDLLLVPEGRVCSTQLELYTRDAIVAEPAGALSIAALENIRESIKGKTVVCILSGGNNDIDRIPEIKERSLIFEGLKHYFLVQFPQRPGALKEFVISVLGPGDDITRFEYMQKHNKETGPALIGIELKVREDIHPLMKRLQKEGFKYKRLSNDQEYLNYFL